MTDFADLGMRFTTQGAEKQVEVLDQIATKAPAAEKGVDDLTASSKRSSDALMRMLAEIQRSVGSLDGLAQAEARAAEAARRQAEAQAAAARANAQAAAAAREAAAAERALDAQIANAIRGQTAYSVALGGGARASKHMGLATLDLSRQFADIGVTVAMGMNPFMILLQQGPQIADRLAVMKQEGVGLGAALKSMAVSMGLLRVTMPAAAARAAELAIAEQAAAAAALEVAVANRAAAASATEQAAANTAAARAAARLAAANEMVAATATQAAVAQGVALAPLALALGTIVGLATAAAGAFLLLNRALSKDDPKDITKGLNLTEEQLERVKSKTITMGDTWKATIEVMGKYLMSGPLGDAFKWLADTWNKTLDFLTKVAFEGTARTVGLFVGAYRTIINNWRNFPAVMGDVFALMVNGVIEDQEALVNAWVAGLNKIKAGAALIRPELRLIPDIPEADLSRFKMKVSGAAEFTANVFASNVNQATEEARGGMRKIGSEIDALRLKYAQERALDEAGKPNKGRKSKDEPSAFDLALMDFEERVKRLRELGREWERAMRDIKPLPDIGLQIDARDAQGAADLADILADRMARVADASRDMANSLRDGFGAAGAALGELIDTLGTFQARQADVFAQQAQDMADRRKAILDANGDQAKIGAANDEWARRRIKSEEDLKQIEAERNIDAIRGVKSLLSEKSAAYKVLTGLEVALQAIQLAGHIKEMAMMAVTTAADIASTLKRIAVKGTEAVINAMRSIPFPFNLAAAAATAAAVIAFGGKLLGGGGGGSSGISAEERQKTQGAGSVLGDADAKSESISRSLDIVAANTNRDLEYSNAMVRSLRSIDQNIGALTNVLARQLGIPGGDFDTSGLGLGTKRGINTSFFGGIPGGDLLAKIPVIGGIVSALFGTKKTTTLLDQGLQFGGQSLADILAGGVDANVFQDIQTKTKKKTFGITTSNKTKTETVTSDLDADILAEMQRVVESLRGGVLAAAGVLGVEGAQATLDAMQIELGKISFKDMTGEEVRAALEAVFGKLGDELAATALPALEELQKAGEGAFETLIRVARQYQVIDVTLSSIGKTFGMIGVASLEARENLVQLFGSLDDFVDQTAFFAENFLTEAERMKPIQAAVVKEFERLGVTGVNNIEQFKQLVLGLDLSTQAGQEMYAALLAVAPAFKTVFDYLNPDAAKEAADGWRGVFESMQEWIRTLNGEITSSVRSTEQAYAALQAAAMAARGGDVGAAGQIVELGKAYLDAARSSASSEFEYLQAVARARAIAFSVQLTAATNAGIPTGAGAATPFSPATSATGSTAPGYTYTPSTTSFDSTGSFTVAGYGPKDFGPVTLHGGEIVDVRKPYQSANDNSDLLSALNALTDAIENLCADQRAGFTALASKIGRVVTVIDRWDGEGLPPDRDAEEAA